MQRTLKFKPTIDERFEQFHASNPEVYRQLVELAFQLKNAGRRRISIETLIGKLRWDRALETDDPSGFKINDNYSSRFVRMLIADHPEFGTMFETRRLKS
jgi:hypothetical protein